jgi:hypothetical protein
MIERHATREPHIASTSGSRARKSGGWLRMQCLPTARWLPFKQDAVFGMSARRSSFGQNTPLHMIKEEQRDR